MGAPGLDAPKMLLIEVARPPRDFGHMPREVDRVLPGAAADFNNVTIFRRQVSLQHASDGLVVAVVCRRVETAVRLDRPPVLAEFDEIFSHSASRSASSRPIRFEL